MPKLRYDGVEVAEGVYQFGDGHVSWYVIEDGGRLTVVDGGLPAHWHNLTGWLSRTRRSLTDIEAVLLTHGHNDHVGIVQRVSDSTDAPVYVHRGDEELAKGKRLHALPERMRRNMFRPHCAALTVRWVIAGAPSARPIAAADFFDHGDVLDLPGRPRVFHTPGHTPGSSCFLLAERGVVFSGDALVTVDLATGKPGMGIMPGGFNADPYQALDSLSVLAGVPADTLLPGHGAPHHGPLSSALAAARSAGVDWHKRTHRVRRNSAV